MPQGGNWQMYSNHNQSVNIKMSTKTSFLIRRRFSDGPNSIYRLHWTFILDKKNFGTSITWRVFKPPFGVDFFEKSIFRVQKSIFGKNDFWQNNQHKKLYQTPHSPKIVAKKWHFNLNLRIYSLVFATDSIVHTCDHHVT